MKKIVKVEKVWRDPDVYSTSGDGMWVNIFHYSDGSTSEQFFDVDEIPRVQGTISSKTLFK